MFIFVCAPKASRAHEFRFLHTVKWSNFVSFNTYILSNIRILLENSIISLIIKLSKFYFILLLVSLRICMHSKSLISPIILCLAILNLFKREYLLFIIWVSYIASQLSYAEFFAIKNNTMLVILFFVFQKRKTNFKLYLSTGGFELNDIWCF